MKIIDVRAIPLIGQNDTTDWTAKFAPKQEDWMHTVIIVETDAGITGYGSVYSGGHLIEAALRFLRPVIVGQSPLGPTAVTEFLHQSTFWQGFGGTLTHAISGVDIALWDIFGKATGQSVSRLLGGRYREQIRPYGSLLMAEPAEMTARVRAAKAKGFRAFKIGWGPFGRRNDPALDEAIVAAARDAAGPECELMVDAGGSEQFWPNGLKWALRTADMLTKYDVAWFEEPLRPDDIEGYIELTKQAPLPISAGEVLTRRQTFLPWLQRHAVDYIQPDVTKSGGLSEQFRIAQTAYDFNVLHVPHGWNTAIGLAADLQLVAALPAARWVEYMTPSQYIDGMFIAPIALNADGMLDIPDRPGLGFEWNLDYINTLSRGALFAKK